MPIIFFNIGWMEEYKGQTKTDRISGGHEYIRKHGMGHEQYNFLPHKGFVYGYAPVTWYSDTKKFQKISIENLGASKHDESIDNVTVVFMAKSPFTGKTYVVGWYKNATVYRCPQELPFKNRRIDRFDIFYVCKAREEDAHCVPASQRVLVIPTAQGDKAGGYGKSTIWYAKKRKDVQEEVLRYINEGEMPHSTQPRLQSGNVDQETKKRIENSAVDATKNFYKELGFQRNDVSEDNCGWDLTVYNAVEEFFVEIKGTANSSVNFQLTPNEYSKLQEHWQKYKIAAAVDCLGELKLDIFSILYDKKREKYLGVNDRGTSLLLTERTEVYALGSVPTKNKKMLFNKNKRV